jgi:hypothetical protein
MTTLTNDEIVKIAKDVATANLVSGTWVDIKSASTIDSRGRDALEIAIVLTAGSLKKITGDRAVNIVFDLNQRLQDAGEERFSIVRYLTS